MHETLFFHRKITLLLNSPFQKSLQICPCCSSYSGCRPCLVILGSSNNQQNLYLNLHMAHQWST